MDEGSCHSATEGDEADVMPENPYPRSAFAARPVNRRSTATFQLAFSHAFLPDVRSQQARLDGFRLLRDSKVSPPP